MAFILSELSPCLLHRPEGRQRQNKVLNITSLFQGQGGDIKVERIPTALAPVLALIY